MRLVNQPLQKKAALIVLHAFFISNILISPSSFAAETIYEFEAGQYQPVIALADIEQSSVPEESEIAKDEVSLQSESPLSAPDTVSTSDTVRTAYYEISAASTSSSSMSVNGRLLIGGTTGSITEIYVRYRQSGTSEYQTAKAYTATTAFDTTLTNLKANTTYEIQVLIPSKGLSSEMLNVKTLVETVTPPVVMTKTSISTPVISNITSSSADVSLNVTGSTAPVTLHYTNTSTGVSGNTVMSKAIESSSYFATLKPLSAGTYSVYAEILESGKDPVRSITRQFQITSVPDPATVKISTPAISAITASTATVNLTVTGAPLASTVVLHYKNLTTGAVQLLGMINQGNGRYMAPLKSLSAGTSYEIHASLSQTGKPDTVSSKTSFKTAALDPITISVPAVSNISTSRADVKVNIGGLPAGASVVLYYKNLTTGVTASSAMVAMGNGVFGTSLTPLNHATSYEIYAQVNASGRNPEKSQTMQFKTNELPPVTISTPVISNITTGTADVKATLTNLTPNSSVKVIYKNLTTGAISTVSMVHSGNGVYSATLRSLMDSTNYEVFIQAVDTNRTFTSAAAQFKTAQNIVSLTAASNSITPHSAKIATVITGAIPTNSIVQVKYWIAGQPLTIQTASLTRSGNGASVTINNLKAETSYEFQIEIVSGGKIIAVSSKASLKTADDVYTLQSGKATVKFNGTVENVSFNVATNWPLPAGHKARVVIESPKQIVPMTASSSNPTQFATAEVGGLGGTYSYHFEIVDAAGKIVSKTSSANFTVTSISAPVVADIKVTSATFTVNVKGAPADSIVYLYYRSTTTGISDRITLPHKGNGVYSGNYKLFEPGNTYEVYAVVLKSSGGIVVGQKAQFKTPFVYPQVTTVTATAERLTGRVTITAKTDLQIPPGYSLRAIFYNPTKKPIVMHTTKLTAGTSNNTFAGAITLPTGHHYTYQVELLDASGKVVSASTLGRILVTGPVQ